MTFRNIKDVEDFRALEQAAKAEGHFVIAPTQVIEKDGGTVGYVSVMPSVIVWVSQKHVKALDSVRALRQIEDALRIAGNKVFTVPCSTDSPFFNHMQRLGFLNVGNATINIKTI